MAKATIYHNPRCSKSNQAVNVAADLGSDVEVVRYLNNPPSAAELRSIIAKLEDPVTALVRRDANFTKYGLTDADVADADQVVAVLGEHPELMERPLLVTAERAVIGRPTERAEELLRSL